jgi:hypothetical protein
MALTYQDFKPYINQKDFDQILQETPGVTTDVAPILADIELLSKTVITDALFSRYDTVAVIDQWTTYPQVKRWMLVLSLYYIYERVPDRLVPPRIVKNYNDVLAQLDQVADGKTSIKLPHKPIETGARQGENTSKFRWGSTEKRSH